MYVMLMRASDVTLNYYHPECVNLKKLPKYKIQGCRFLFVKAGDVKREVGEEKWRTLSAEVNGYMVLPAMVVRAQAARKKSYPAGEKCRCCGHLIYRVRRYGLRCGPGCDRAEPFN
jgi:hypothetical protein